MRWCAFFGKEMVFKIEIGKENTSPLFLASRRRVIVKINFGTNRLNSEMCERRNNEFLGC